MFDVMSEPLNCADQPKQLVEEVPIAITINGLHYSVMLASPHDLEDFGFGYLLSEGIITDHIQVHDLQCIDIDNGINLNIVLANRQLHLFKSHQRQIKGTSGCGLCGKEAMELAFPMLEKLSKGRYLSKTKIETLKSQLKDWQTLAKTSGALHAAFWVDASGNIVVCREDIGRHNAVDKVVGFALRNELAKTDASILVTSRCSVEIVQKAVRSKVGSLISLASPTQMALDFSLQYHLNLIHIPRMDSPRLLTPGNL
ncbi:MAG: formate dehydrogenase accessory sulfurtransferase FdhD [Pseudomonadota bacterium]